MNAGGNLGIIWLVYCSVAEEWTPGNLPRRAREPGLAVRLTIWRKGGALGPS